MRLARVAAIAPLLVILVSTIACGSNDRQEPTPTLTPGTGTIIGRVLFHDGSPAEGEIVYISRLGEESVFLACDVDDNGYYTLNLPVGNYNVFTAYTHEGAVFEGSKSAVTVLDRETTVIPAFTVLGNIDIIFDDLGTAVSAPVIDGNKPEFNWPRVDNASYYKVAILSSFPYYRDYYETYTVTNNIIVWSADLSSLPYQEFGIDVDAYTTDDVMIATGYELFTVE